MSKILTIIPARGGSQGVPRKNIKPLGGLPLIVHTIKAVQDAGLTDYVVATDDAEITAVAKKYGSPVIVLPSKLTTDSALIAPVIQYVLSEKEKEGIQYDFVAFANPTSPFRGPEPIKEAIKKIESGAFDSCFVAFIPHSFEFKWKKKSNGEFESADYPLDHRPRRQDLPEIYHENGSFYIIRKDLFKKTGNRYGGAHARITLVLMSEEDSLQIDSPHDFWLAEELFKKKKKK